MEPVINKLFAYEQLSDLGRDKAHRIAVAYTRLLTELESDDVCGADNSREKAIVKTKLQEAKMFSVLDLKNRPMNLAGAVRE